MLDLLNTPTIDNEKNIANAELCVNKLKETLDAFKLNLNVTYNVYHYETIFTIFCNDDNVMDKVFKIKKEIAVALGIAIENLKMIPTIEETIEIKVKNIKQNILTLKETLLEYKKDNTFKVILGMDEKDKVVYFDFDKEEHLLVTGVTGSGKTNLFNNIIMNILINYDDTRIIILDSQGINYNDYDGVCEVITKEDKIIEKIKLIRDEFEDRFKNGNKERIIVFIDEIYEILSLDVSVKDDINYLLAVANVMNIHLILSTDTILEDNTYYLFKRIDMPKLTFYMTSRREYNLFMDEVINESLDRKGVFIGKKFRPEIISVPLIMDDEIKRVVDYEKEKRKEEKGK